MIASRQLRVVSFSKLRFGRGTNSCGTVEHGRNEQEEKARGI